MAVREVIIVGSGPAGWTAAIYAARAGLSPLVITGVEPGGQLTTTTDVDNWPADADGVQGPELMERFERHARRFDTAVVRDRITQVNLSERPFQLTGEREVYAARSLIVATGASAKYLGLESETRYRGRGVSACATCDGFFHRNKTVAVVGGGNTAVEEALYLANIAARVILIHRRNTFRAEAIMQDLLMKQVEKERVVLRLDSTVEEILGDGGGVNGVRVRVNDGTHQSFEVSGVFIAIGHVPNTSVFEGVLDMEGGYLITRGGHRGLATETSVAGVFAAGDVQDSVYRQAVTSAASGCMAALDAKRFLEESDG